MRTTKHKAEVQHPAYLCVKASASLSKCAGVVLHHFSHLPVEEPHDAGAKLKHQNMAPIARR